MTITQATEIGTVYSLPEIGEIAAISAKRNLPLHMDAPASPMHWSRSAPPRLR